MPLSSEKEIRRVQNQAYYQENKERIKARRRDKYKDNPEPEKLRNKMYRQKKAAYATIGKEIFKE